MGKQEVQSSGVSTGVQRYISQLLLYNTPPPISHSWQEISGFWRLSSGMKMLLCSHYQPSGGFYKYGDFKTVLTISISKYVKHIVTVR